MTQNCYCSHSTGEAVRLARVKALPRQTLPLYIVWLSFPQCLLVACVPDTALGTKDTRMKGTVFAHCLGKRDIKMQICHLREAMKG